MPKECPTCGREMENTGFSGDVRHRGEIVGLDIENWTCPNCETIVDDMGNVVTKRDQQHWEAWQRYAAHQNDFSIIHDRRQPERRRSSDGGENASNSARKDV